MKNWSSNSTNVYNVRRKRKSVRKVTQLEEMSVMGFSRSHFFFIKFIKKRTESFRLDKVDQIVIMGNIPIYKGAHLIPSLTHMLFQKELSDW